MKPVVKNLGNFSAEVAKGLIGYSREKEGGKMVGILDLPKENLNLPPGDGYATKEGDILLGGFIQRRVAQEAARRNQRLVELDIQAKEDLAHQIWKEHIRQFGDVGNENYRHWLVRVRSFATKRSIQLPPKNSNETEHNYFYRLRKWIAERPDKWPKFQKAVGTHLVFSPDPKIWPSLRAAGADERHFLRCTLTQTFKDFSDWRRKLVGTDHSLGWVAGTHVHANGADRHPHIHVIILKRDEAGKEVDWSVSELKGRKGDHDPDPLKEIKRLFAKNVQKQLELILGKEAVASFDIEKQPNQSPTIPRSSAETWRISERLRALGKGLKATSLAMRSYRPLIPGRIMGKRSEMGSMLRLVALFHRNSRNKGIGIDSDISILRQKIHSLFHSPSLQTPNLQPEL
jgi:hypothetical protein